MRSTANRMKAKIETASRTPGFEKNRTTRDGALLGRIRCRETGDRRQAGKKIGARWNV
jgi:hypothetical protein